MLFNGYKKIIALILVLSLTVAFFACGGNENPQESQPSNESSSSVSDVSDIQQDISLPEVSYPKAETCFSGKTLFDETPYIGIYNASTLTEYYSQNSTQRIYPASLTKMVTALVALKYCSADTLFVAGDELDFVNEGSSIMWLGKGMELSLEQLIYGLMLPSGNDAAYTVAVNVARAASGDEKMQNAAAVEYFAKLMNEYCASIGAVNSHFVNPEGWDDPNQYTTVADLALIYSYGINNTVISTAMATPQISFVSKSGHRFDLKNTNRLIDPESSLYNPNIIGGKTGTTDNAGACLVSVLNMYGERYILIAAKCADNNSRFTQTQQLIQLAVLVHYYDDNKTVIGK